MRAVGVHTDVIVLISAIWQTTATAVRAGDEGFLIDSPVLPDELDALGGVLQQAGFPASGLLATHADWDHLLGRLAFPQAALGLAESSAARLGAHPGDTQRKLRDFDQEHYIERPRPLSLSALQPLPVPGGLSLGSDHELELHPAPGHTPDGMAIWIPWTGTLVCGDYLSPVEVPMISEGGSWEGYLDTLEQLVPLVGDAETVVPGHGAPLGGEQAGQILREDVAYLRALGRDGVAAGLPRGRQGHAQRRIHERNAQRLSATPPQS